MGEPLDLAGGFVEAKARAVERFERAYLGKMLAQHEGNVSRAARAAGIDRMHFKRILARRQPMQFYREHQYQ